MRNPNHNASLALPNHNTYLRAPRKCKCGCGLPVKRANKAYATQECWARDLHKGRYKTLEEDLAGKH